MNLAMKNFSLENSSGKNPPILMKTSSTTSYGRRLSLRKTNSRKPKEILPQSQYQKSPYLWNSPEMHKLKKPHYQRDTMSSLQYSLKKPQINYLLHDPMITPLTSMTPLFPKWEKFTLSLPKNKRPPKTS